MCAWSSEYRDRSKQKIYAWIKQIATSNRMYPTVVNSRRIKPDIDVNHAAAQ